MTGLEFQFLIDGYLTGGVGFAQEVGHYVQLFVKLATWWKYVV
jgi:hypothetical protein